MWVEGQGRRPCPPPHPLPTRVREAGEAGPAAPPSPAKNDFDPVAQASRLCSKENQMQLIGRAVPPAIVLTRERLRYNPEWDA